MKFKFKKKVVAMILFLSIGMSASTYLTGSRIAEANRVNSETLDDKDYNNYLKKIWIGEGYDARSDGYLYPISFFISKIENGYFEGGGYIGGIGMPDFYYYRFTPRVLTMKGNIKNGIAYGQFDEPGYKGSIKIKFENADRIEAMINFTEISYSDPEQFERKREGYSDLQYKPVNGTYLYRPYNLDDIKIFTQPDKEQIQVVDLNSWGKVHLVTEMTNANKPHPSIYLTDVNNNILYLFDAPFQTASKITNVTVKDLNGDGLKDIQVDNVIEQYTFVWTFYQTENGFFYDSGIFEREKINSSTEDLDSTAASESYSKYMNVPATGLMPELTFELTGIYKADEYYYPKKLVIRANNNVLQEFDFNEEDFAPCTIDDFGWEYGDYKFDGYGGFRLLSTSLGKNPSYYFWTWNKEENRFIENSDLTNVVGYMTFDYNNKLIYVTGSGGNDYHEFETYKYIQDRLTLIEKAIDTEGYRKIYKVENNELKLIEIIESPLFD